MAAQTAKLLWSLDLSSDPDFQKRPSVAWQDLVSLNLSFIDSSTLALAFDNASDSYAEPGPPPNDFVIAAIGVNRGKLEKRLRIPATAGTSGAVSVSDDTLITLIGDSISKFSKDLSKLAELKLTCQHGIQEQESPTQDCHLKSASLDVTPGESQVSIRQIAADGPIKWIWVRPEDLSIVTVWPGQWSQGFAAGNFALILEPGRGAPSLVTKDDGRSLCERCWHGYFITDEILLLDYGGSFQIIDPTGAILAHGKLGTPIDSLARSRTAPRVAFVTTGSRFSRSSHSHVHIFDWKTMKEIEHWQYTGPSQERDLGATQTRIAISPDGKGVALLVNKRLMYYSIP